MTKPSASRRYVEESRASRIIDHPINQRGIDRYDREREYLIH